MAEMRKASVESGSGGAGQDMALSEEQLEKLKEYYGFDKPWYVAYVHWLGDIFQGDFGQSFIYYEPVTKVIADRLPISIYFGITTLILTYLVCIRVFEFPCIHGHPFASINSVQNFIDSGDTITS